jgi:putative phage-type endonuclease
MKVIQLEQGSQEWLSWRKTVITATDASVIMGNNPWDTPYTCWQRKLGLIEEKKSNEAMERGKRLEPEARAQFVDYYGIDMVPVVVESTEFEFLGASLDGISKLGNTLLEIKCGGTKLHDMASRGEIPAYYRDQMQHQLIVTGAEKCFYYSYNGKDGICIEVFPDAEYKAAFIPKAREFWRCIAFSEPPELQHSDYKDMSHDPFWKLAAKQYREVSEQIKILEEVKEIHRKEILRRSSEKNCLGDGIKVIKTVMRGRIAYDEIAEIKDIDLDKYRKKSTTTWKILVT